MKTAGMGVDVIARGETFTRLMITALDDDPPDKPLADNELWVVAHEAQAGPSRAHTHNPSQGAKAGSEHEFLGSLLGVLEGDVARIAVMLVIAVPLALSRLYIYATDISPTVQRLS